MIAIGLWGVGYVVTAAVLLATASLDEHHAPAVAVWGVPAWLLLSAVGAASPAATVRRQMAARRSAAFE
ncbi:hypothetical protein [Nocardia lijiangensis]|uniref:hypothetical protein n=1 Tax=Nocardia lijiangensis TaxID=299618 RepID=UPI000836E28A|nr:hypothetical protein [Nocardia lijiangensis]